MRASDVSIRMNNCSVDISRLKIPTVLRAWTAALSAMLRTRLVLPMDGRAATMTRSCFWKPDVISSSCSNPLGTPVMSPLCAWSRSIS